MYARINAPAGGPPDRASLTFPNARASAPAATIFQGTCLWFVYVYDDDDDDDGGGGVDDDGAAAAADDDDDYYYYYYY